jgi:hypothetical protein
MPFRPPQDRNQPQNQSQAIIQDLEAQDGLIELRPSLFHLGMPLASLKEDEIVDVIRFEMNDDGSVDFAVKSLQGKEESIHLESTELGQMLLMVKSLVPPQDVGTKMLPRNPARSEFFQAVQELQNVRRSAMV